jgi:hypothetical protein
MVLKKNGYPHIADENRLVFITLHKYQVKMVQKS